MEDSGKNEQRRRYEPPAVSTESLPLLPLVELGTGIGGNSLPKRPGQPPPQ